MDVVELMQLQTPHDELCLCCGREQGLDKKCLPVGSQADPAADFTPKSIAQKTGQEQVLLCSKNTLQLL